MKKSLFVALCLSFALLSQAQGEKHPAVIYLDAFSEEFFKIQELQIDYTSHLIHGRGAVITQKRDELKQAAIAAVAKVEAIPAYENDKGLKKAAIETFKSIESMTNKDYAAIVQQKAGCTECFAAMEIEFEVTEQAAEEAHKALIKMHKKIDLFAKEHEIQLIDGESELAKTMAKINRINGYLEQIDLSISQASFASDEVVKAFNTQNIKIAEAAVKKMNKEMNEAQKRFKAVSSIPDDAVCIVKARLVMDFYQKMTDEMYPDMLKAFDKKGNITEAGVKIFNKNIEKINNQLPNKQAAYNQTKIELMQKSVPPPTKSFKG